jgi:hypothetical protein
MGKVFSSLGNGRFSTGVLCECSAGAVLCDDCFVVLRNKQQTCAAVDWWHALGGGSELKCRDDVGVSDAIGTQWVCGRERRWLACVNMFCNLLGCRGSTRGVHENGL